MKLCIYYCFCDHWNKL